MDLVFRELRIADRLRLRPLDPLYRMRLPDRDVMAHADLFRPLFRYESELIGHFPGQAAGIRAFLDETLAVYHDVRRLEEDQAAGRAPAPADLPVRYPALARASAETWEQMMARHVVDPRVRTVVGAFWLYVGLPPSRCAAVVGAVLIGAYHEHGGWYPHGGSQALSEALISELGDRGGQVRYEQW